MVEKKTFTGFHSEEVNIPVPESFFSQLLPNIDDLNEIKIIMFCVWQMSKMDASFPYLYLDTILDSEFLKSTMTGSSSPSVNIKNAIQKAIDHNVLIMETVGDNQLFMLNTPRGRAAIQAIQSGQWNPEINLESAPVFVQSRLNIFKLYETHVGPLTPMMVEVLKDAENSYPPEWIEEAFKISVEMNKRNWKYIQAILRRWEEGGRNVRRDQQGTQKEYDKYSNGDYSDYFER